MDELINTSRCSRRFMFALKTNHGSIPSLVHLLLLAAALIHLCHVVHFVISPAYTQCDETMT